MHNQHCNIGGIDLGVREMEREREISEEEREI
jgi:hypothetical protein